MSSTEDSSQQAAGTTAPLPVAIPRYAHVRHFDGSAGQCPRCKGPLSQAQATVLLLARRRPDDDETQAYVMSGQDVALFCPACPTAVLREQSIEERLERLYADSNKASYALLGLIDLDAIPTDQKHLPLNEVDPLPLRHFLTDEPVKAKAPKFVQDRARLKGRKRSRR